MLEQDNNSTEQSKTTVEVSATDARRGFLKKAAIGAPIVIASSTKPAWGAACLSGMMSGNVSDHGAQCNLRSGRSPQEWRSEQIGAKKWHWLNNTKPPQGQRTRNKIKAIYRDHYKKYYVNISGTLHYSNFHTYDELFGDKIWRNLRDGDLYTKQIIAAFLNASLQAPLGYDYSPSDVNEIADAVEMGDADANKVGNMLADIHA